VKHFPFDLNATKHNFPKPIRVNKKYDAQDGLALATVSTGPDMVRKEKVRENAIRSNDFVRNDICIMKKIVQEIGYHELFVNALGFSIETKPFSLVLEYCDGGNVQRWLGEAREWLLQNVREEFVV
jgi:hypothetical protein